MKPGQYWPILLSDGRYACGRVLQIAQDYGPTDTKTFLAGLMDWSGDFEPTSADLAGIQLLASGSAHVKTMTNSGGSITGSRELEADNLTVPLSLDQAPGANCRLTRGYEVLGIASQEEQDNLSVFATWGYNFITRLAEKHFASP